jgi:hypothetical protein
VKIGAHALAATGQALESRALERLLNDVSDKAATSTAAAAELTGQAVKAAAETVSRAAADAKTAFIDADTQHRKELTAAVTTAKDELNAQLRRTFGGDNPELLERLQPVLDKFSLKLDATMKSETAELIAKAAKQFDPSDPSSPMAKYTAELGVRQDKLAEQLGKDHAELTAKVDGLALTLKVEAARSSLAKVTPIKGSTYANQLHSILTEIATGLGDEYTDTGAVTGSVPRSKKGDGALTVDGGVARVVFEMTDSPRTGWTDYLAEAERNRDATASLGLVRTLAQNGGESIRVLGSRRLVMAFDPNEDNPALLRTVVMLVRTTAIVASSRQGGHQLATAQEKIAEALGQLSKVDGVKKLADLIQKNATKIETSCTEIHASIQRLLAEATAALTDAEPANNASAA